MPFRFGTSLQTFSETRSAAAINGDRDFASYSDPLLYHQGNRQYLTGLGAILMRAGQYEEAKRELEKSLAATGSGVTSPSYIRYFLALTEQNLGNSEPARLQLQAANKLADEELAGAPIWNRKFTLELLRSEAQTAIGEVGE